MRFLLQPLHIRQMTLNNRLVLPPMATAKADADGHVTPAILEYYDEKTRGGNLGLVIVEHSYIRLDGKASRIQISCADDSDLPGLAKLAEMIHHNGSCAAMQLNHAGSAAQAEVTGSMPVGPSALPHPRGGGVPRELSEAEIDGLVEAFADAARRTREAGFDAVEIHSAHGYLLNQFYSPLSNQRQDAFGGDAQKRIALHCRIVKAVRAVVGDDFPILLRLGALDYMKGGSTLEDCLFAVRELVRAGVDILDISGGFAGFNIPGLSGQGIFADVTASVRQSVPVPVILTGGITNAHAAEELLRDGKADLIGVGRAILADSDWARQAIESLG